MKQPYRQEEDDGLDPEERLGENDPDEEDDPEDGDEDGLLNGDDETLDPDELPKKTGVQHNTLTANKGSPSRLPISLALW